MNYKDIPRIPNPNYRTDISLDLLETTLERYAENQVQFGYKFELNPDFQRGYVWTEKQQIAYVEWLLMGGRSGREIYFNHPDWMKNFNGDMVCLDGLQRLTACLRFLHNEIAVFGEYRDFIKGNIPFDITLSFNVFTFKTRREILNWYLVFNSGGTVHSEKDLEKVRKLLEKES